MVGVVLELLARVLSNPPPLDAAPNLVCGKELLQPADMAGDCGLELPVMAQQTTEEKRKFILRVLYDLESGRKGDKWQQLTLLIVIVR